MTIVSGPTLACVCKKRDFERICDCEVKNCWHREVVGPRQRREGHSGGERRWYAGGSVLILQACDMGREFFQSRPPREVELEHLQSA